MKRIENGCVDCPDEMGCWGSACPNRNITYYYCDKCGNETKLYYYDGLEICEECLLEEFDVVEGSEW